MTDAGMVATRQLHAIVGRNLQRRGEMLSVLMFFAGLISLTAVAMSLATADLAERSQVA
jgi:hypothetical protein